MKNYGFPGSGQTDFGPQLKSMNKQLFTIVAWDPRGYGQSIPPSRDFPPDFFERDAKDAVDLMQVNLFSGFIISPYIFKICFPTVMCCFQQIASYAKERTNEGLKLGKHTLFWKIFSSSISSAVYTEVQQWGLIIKQYIFIPEPCP